MKIRSIMVIVLVTVCFTTGLRAQEKMKDTMKLDEFVVTSNKTRVSAGNVTQKMDVINQYQILQSVSPNRNLAELLSHLPGSSVSALSRNDANWGTYAGIGPKYCTYMLNGLPLDAFVDPMNIDPAALGQIEVQRGPASVLYPNYLSQDFAGNQSPLAGTVNLILREKIEQPLTRFSTGFGSYNTFSGQFYHQDHNGNLHYVAGANFENSDYTDYGIPNSWLNMKKNPEYKKTKVFGNATWLSDDEKQKFTFFASKTFHQGDAGRVYRGFDHDYGVINTGYSAELCPKTTLRANVGVRQYDRQWQESNYNVVDSLSSNNGVVQRIVPADISITYKHGDGSNLVAGTDYQGAEYYNWSDPLQGFRSYGNKSTALQAGVYAQEEYHWKGLIVRAGVRYNYIKNHIDLISGSNPGRPSMEWTSLLYSGGVKYKINDMVSLYANVGNSFMTPGLKSVGGTIKADDTVHSGQLPNPDLLPESGMGVDGGFELSLPFNIRFSARVFDLMVTDAIIDNVVKDNPSQTKSVNAGETSSMGGEVEVKQKLNKQLSWFANFTYMKTEISHPYDTDQDGASVPFAPEQVANAGLTYTAPFGLNVSPVWSYNGGYYDSSSKLWRKKFVPGAIYSLNISQVIAKKENVKTEIFGQFYNLSNNKFKMPWQFQDTGFSVMGGLRIQF